MQIDKGKRLETAEVFWCSEIMYLFPSEVFSLKMLYRVLVFKYYFIHSLILMLLKQIDINNENTQNAQAFVSVAQNPWHAFAEPQCSV